MIAAYLSCDDRVLPPPLVQRFAASLGVGLGKAAQHHLLTNCVMAAMGKPRGWRAQRTAQGAYVMFAGHIDNREEVQQALGRAYADDAALYAAAYDAWGGAADLRLIGQFASIMVLPEAKGLRLCRSPLRAPPLHYYRDADRIIAGSTARVVFATGEVPQEVDEQKIADSLFLNYCEAERGWFKGVGRLPTGTRCVITADAVHSTRYYNLLALPDVRFRSDDDYVEAANALFTQATQAALSGRVRPAVSLSGGYDSQAVAAFAMAARPDQPLLGLTGVPEPEWDGRVSARRFGDERPHVTALAAMYPQLATEWVDAAGLSFDHQAQAMFLLSGTAPRNAMNLHWIHALHARAKQRGCDVLLTGALGNATFSFAGDGMVADLFRKGRLVKAVQEVWASGPAAAFPRSFVSQAIMPNLPRRVWMAVHRVVHGKSDDPFKTWCPMHPDWAVEMRVAERAADMGYDQHYQPFTSTREWRAQVLGNAMNEGGDIEQAFELLHGMPVRDPTAYRPLVEFCTAIPDDQYQRKGKRRWLAKRMLQGKVPDMVLRETRRGLQAADWHLRIGREREQLIGEIDRLAGDAVMAKRLDLPSLKAALEDWPKETPLTSETTSRIMLAVSRGLTTARFIRFVEGRNDH